MGLVRILTLNIWNRSGPWEHRLRLIRKGIAEAAPDVIGLQEVVHRPDVPSASQEHEIVTAWKDAGGPAELHTAFAPAWSYAGGDQFGNAVVSRFPILEARSVPLPTADARVVLACRLDTPDGVLPVYVTHLSWRLDEGAVREAQALAVAGLIRDLEQPGELPAILMGDLNAGPDATEIRFLRGLHALEKTSTFFTDCFERAGSGPPFTFDPEKNPHAALTFEVPRRIDYVLVRGPRDDGRGMPVSARVVLDEVVTEGGVRIAPSDHHGVLAEVRV
jgi:endonuclease/exonuclease/phosphatase family metal-dependent hydrolase